MDGRKTQSAKAVDRTPHDTRNRSRPNSAGCTPSNVKCFDTKKIKEWLKKNPNCELKRAADKPIYYSTERKDGKLSLKPEANVKTLKTDYIKCAKGLSLCGQKKKQLETKYRCPYLDIELECLMKEYGMAGRTFVCQGALLNEVGFTPYRAKDQEDKGVKFAIEQIGETIYLWKYRLNCDDEAKPQTKLENTNESVGLMFERHLTQESGIPCEPNEQFCALVKAKMGSYQLLISGEIDCLDGKGQLVELKTSMHEIEDVHFLERTKWWLQCYLLGVKTIVVGKHDDHKCTDVIDLPVPSDAPAEPQNLRHWVDRATPTTSQICLGAIHKFLTEVDQYMERQAKTTKTVRKIYLFERQPQFTSFTVKPSPNIAKDQFIENGMIERLIAKNCPSPTATPTDSAAQKKPLDHWHNISDHKSVSDTQSNETLRRQKEKSF